MKSRLVLLLMIVLCSTVTSCSSFNAAGREVGQQLQCERDNANRPDGFQREIECKDNARQQARAGN